ncbi:MAG: hypothetical protein IIY78_01190 [Clostridia bacterium]|nr:hypothetical protein [Clostridia bacterium]
MRKEKELSPKVYAGYSTFSIVFAVSAVMSVIGMFIWRKEKADQDCVTLICSLILLILSRTRDEAAEIKKRCTYEVTARLSRTKTKVVVPKNEEDSTPVYKEMYHDFFNYDFEGRNIIRRIGSTAYRGEKTSTNYKLMIDPKQPELYYDPERILFNLFRSSNMIYFILLGISVAYYLAKYL